MRALFVIACAALSLLALGCTEKKSSAAGSQADSVASGDEGPVPYPIVRDESANLLFSYVDVNGRIQAAQEIAKIPEDVRARVLVVDLQKTPQERAAHRYAFFADLRAKKPDGTYPVSVVSRYNAATSEGEPPTLLQNVPAGTVVLYSAVWCGFCKKAEAWLKEKGVGYVKRDVEKERGVAAELQTKLHDAGMNGGGVPVLDWDGTLVVGFDKPRLESLLASKSKAANAPLGAGTP